jgi:hypothetical protein
MTRNTIVHDEGAASLEDARQKVKLSAAVIKIGLDVHARVYVSVAQYDYLLPKPARRFAPPQFVPWVEGLLRAGHQVRRGRLGDRPVQQDCVNARKLRGGSGPGLFRWRRQHHMAQGSAGIRRV